MTKVEQQFGEKEKRQDQSFKENNIKNRERKKEELNTF